MNLKSGLVKELTINNKPSTINRKHFVFSIDIEDWFQVENLKEVISPDEWDSKELRVEQNTEKVLDILDRHEVQATFFVLGWIAERCPDLVKKIAAHGHEIASHGYGHELLHKMSREEIREDFEKALEIIQPLAENTITGYRSPSFSITDTAADVLKELGFKYDASFNKFQFNERYGAVSFADETAMAASLPRSDADTSGKGQESGDKSDGDPKGSELGDKSDGVDGSGFIVEGRDDQPTTNNQPKTKNQKPTTAHVRLANGLIEFPVTVNTYFGIHWPLGGGYFRLSPMWFLRKQLSDSLRSAQSMADGSGFMAEKQNSATNNQQPTTNNYKPTTINLYLHPWEFDPDQPRVSGLSFKNRFRHYYGLKHTSGKFEKFVEMVKSRETIEITTFGGLSVTG